MSETTRLKRLVDAFLKDCEESLLPPESGNKAVGQAVIPFEIIRGTSRGYLEKITHQVNGTYQNGWYDACAVMIRKLMETLIIEAFEANGIVGKIKNPAGNFLFLSDLVTATLAETTWNLSRNTKKSLPKLKDVGDKSAHNRRFVAVRNDIDLLKNDLRVVIQELVTIAKLK
jgi:hypothetical protein